MRYGYLEPKSPILGEYRTEAEMIRGIKQMQEFAGLKGTGVIDEETVKLISTPRCSLPDVGPGDRMKRRKRYALHDTIWRKTVRYLLMICMRFFYCKVSCFSTQYKFIKKMNLFRRI